MPQVSIPLHTMLSNGTGNIVINIFLNKSGLLCSNQNGCSWIDEKSLSENAWILLYAFRVLKVHVG